MLITLTCPCGNKLSIANATAGQKSICPACGQAMTVPAMGVLAEPKGKAKATTAPTSSRGMGVAFLAAGVFVLFAAGIVWLTWSLTRETPTETPVIAAQKTPDEKRPVPLPKDEKRPGLEPKASPPVIAPPVDHKPPTVVAPIKPSIDTGKPKEPLIEPVKPTPPMVAVIEPVKQVGELPNPFLMPFRPALDPPKVAEKKPNVMEPLRLVWKLKEGDAFFQELMVAQKPTFKVQGIAIASVLQYRIVSKFTVKKVHADGSLTVEQKIESAKLLLADDLTKPAVAGAIDKMPGTIYKLELSAKMDVTKLEGAVGNPKVGALDFGGAMGVQMTSLIDRDGWKELAQSTFFQMDQPLKANVRWSKPMTHNWGGLGSWSGQIHYLYLGKQVNQHKIAYGLQLVYKAPAAGAIGILKVNGANFQTQQAEGVLLFDADKGRVIAAEERFRVKGFINAMLLGQNTPIEIDEDQHFVIRIHDKFP